VLDTIDAGTQYLEKRGIEDARRCMQLLVGDLLGLTKVQLYLEFDHPLSEEELIPLRDKLKKRGEGVPLQHLLGEAEFFNRDFISDSRGLIPRPETEELVELALKLNLPETPHILDIGTGSGVIGLTLAAELPKASVTLCDLSLDALALTKENALKLNLTNVNFLESDVFSKVQDSYDLIISNPPYIEEGERPKLSREVQHDPDMALFSGIDGLDIIRRICAESSSHLHPKGWLAMEIGYNQANATLELLHQAGFTQTNCYKDLSGIARFPFAQKN